MDKKESWERRQEEVAIERAAKEISGSWALWRGQSGQACSPVERSKSPTKSLMFLEVSMTHLDRNHTPCIYYWDASSICHLPDDTIHVHGYHGQNTDVRAGCSVPSWCRAMPWLTSGWFLPLMSLKWSVCIHRPDHTHRGCCILPVFSVLGQPWPAEGSWRILSVWGYWTWCCAKHPF